MRKRLTKWKKIRRSKKLDRFSLLFGNERFIIMIPCVCMRSNQIKNDNTKTNTCKTHFKFSVFHFLFLATCDLFPNLYLLGVMKKGEKSRTKTLIPSNRSVTVQRNSIRWRKKRIKNQTHRKKDGKNVGK